MGRLTALEAELKRNGLLTPSEQAKLIEIAKYYRKLLAEQIAQRAYLEMKDFGQIDEELRHLGFRLVKIVNSRIPVLEEIRP